MIYKGFFVVSMCLLSLPAFSQDTYTVILVGNIAGEMRVDKIDDKNYTIHFEYTDRGRGPAIDSVIELHDSGVPLRIRNTGNNYVKGPIDETFSITGNTARWSSTTEKGEVPLPETAFFLSNNGTPYERALLAQMLLNDGDHSVALLPAGRAELEHVGDVDLVIGGDKRTLKQYDITGLDYEPQVVWLNPDGSLFAIVGGWLSILPDGQTDVRDQLMDLQRKTAAVRQKTMAQLLGKSLDHGLAFTRVNVFDTENRRMLMDQTVVIEGDTITAIGKDSTIGIPASADVINAMGKTLIPGMWDMHAHVSSIDGPLNIAAGVTTIRDLANDMDGLLDLKKRWGAGDAIGPRIIHAGILDGPGPFAGPTQALVDTEEEVIDWLDRYKNNGYEQIKIYSSIKVDLASFIINGAHDRGMRVSGHIPAHMWAEDAINAGYDEIQHINMFFLNFYKDVGDTRTPARFIEVAKRGADLDLESDEVKAFVKLIKDNDVVYDPTVMVFEELITSRPGEDPAGFAAIIDRLPPQVQRGMRGGGIPAPDGREDRAQAAFERMLDVIAHMHEQGIPIVAGTDAMAGFALHRELELYSQAGIPNKDVLYIATLGAAKVMSRDDRLGAIKPGMLADVALIDGNPLEDMSDIRKVELVIKDGVLYNSHEVYGAIGVH